MVRKPQTFQNYQPARTEETFSREKKSGMEEKRKVDDQDF